MIDKSILIEKSLHLIDRECRFKYEDIETELYEMNEHNKEEIEIILDTIHSLLGNGYDYSISENQIQNLKE